MGFKEEVKIYLSTIGANTLDDGMSKGTWNLVAPVHAPNANYKIKLQISNAIFPSTYTKIGSDRQNNKLTLAWSTDPNFDPASAVSSGDSVTVDMGDQFNRLTTDNLQIDVNDKLVAQLVQDPKTADIKYKPVLLFDSTDNLTFTLVVWDYESTAHPYLDGTNTPLQPAIATPDIQDYHWKIVTQADNTGLPDSSLRLANVLGFPRTFKCPPASNVNLTNVSAPRVPDLLSTKFIKIMSNLKTASVDPNTRDFRNVLAVVPITQSYDDDSGVYYVGNVQAPQYITIASPTLERIEIALFDDHDNPLQMHNDWFIELTALFEESEKTDAYRGMDTLAMPSLKHNVYDPQGYRRLHEEIRDNKRSLEDMENDERSSNMLRHGPRSGI